MRVQLREAGSQQGLSCADSCTEWGPEQPGSTGRRQGLHGNSHRGFPACVVFVGDLLSSRRVSFPAVLALWHPPSPSESFVRAAGF